MREECCMNALICALITTQSHRPLYSAMLPEVRKHDDWKAACIWLEMQLEVARAAIRRSTNYDISLPLARSATRPATKVLSTWDVSLSVPLLARCVIVSAANVCIRRDSYPGRRFRQRRTYRNIFDMERITLILPISYHTNTSVGISSAQRKAID